MEAEIRFFAPLEQDVKTTVTFFEAACKKNIWLYDGSYYKKDNKYYGWCKKNESTKDELISLVIYSHDYSTTWVEDNNINLKPYISQKCYYIMYFDFCYSLDFMLDFAIAFLEENPTSYVETLDSNEVTYFDEYKLEDLYKIRELGYSHEWSLYYNKRH